MCTSTAAASTSVLRYLASKVDFDGPYSIEGAHGVASVVDKHVARAMRAIEPKLAERKAEEERAAAERAEAERMLALLAAQETEQERLAAELADAGVVLKAGLLERREEAHRKSRRFRDSRTSRATARARSQ